MCTCLLRKLMLSQQISSPLALLDPPVEPCSYLLTNCRVKDEPLENLRLMSVESSTKLARLGGIKFIQIAISATRTTKTYLTQY